LLALPQPHPWATAVLVDEFDAGCLKRTAYGEVIGGCERNFVFRDLSTADCIHAQS
jgi:hypothetical protein